MNASAPVSASNPTTAADNTAGVSASAYTELAGRVLLASLFLLSGLSKIGAYSGTAGYMAAVGVPPALLPLVIATEALGALAIILGWQTHIAAFLLAGYTLLAGLIFHSNFGDQIQMIMFLKNVSIAGGLLLLMARGAGPVSIDQRLASQRTS